MCITVICISTGNAHHTFELVMTTHLRVGRIDSPCLCETALEFYRAKPCSKEVGTKAHNYFGSIKTVCWDSAFSVRSFISQQKSSIRDSIILNVPAAWIFGEE